MRKEMEREIPWGFKEGPYPWFKYDYKAGHKRGLAMIPAFLIVIFVVPACLAYYLMGDNEYFLPVIVTLALLNIPVIIFVWKDSRRSDKKALGSYQLIATGNRAVYKAILEDINQLLEESLELPISNDMEGQYFLHAFWNMQDTSIIMQMDLETSRFSVRLGGLANSPITGNNLMVLFDKYIYIDRKMVTLRVPKDVPEIQY